MIKSSSSTSVAESAGVGDIRSPCGAVVEVVDEHVVITASSVSSGTLQAASAAESKPEQECLLKSTEAISSSRLYSNTHTEHSQVEKVHSEA